MTYTLYIGDKSFSSWSLRGLLMLENFDLPYRSKNIGLYSGHMAQDMAPLAPARLVPVLQTPEGDVVQDTLAIAETLAERHPRRWAVAQGRVCPHLRPLDRGRDAFRLWPAARNLPDEPATSD